MLLFLKGDWSIHGCEQTKNTTSMDRLMCMSFSSMLIAFVLSACSRRHLVWWARTGQTVGNMLEVCVCEWVSLCVFVLQCEEASPTGSPTANQTGWTETGPPLPLSHVAYRTEPQRQTGPQFATPSETSDGPPSGTERHVMNPTMQTFTECINLTFAKKKHP